MPGWLNTPGAKHCTVDMTESLHLMPFALIVDKLTRNNGYIIIIIFRHKNNLLVTIEVSVIKSFWSQTLPSGDL